MKKAALIGGFVTVALGGAVFALLTMQDSGRTWNIFRAWYAKTPQGAVVVDANGLSVLANRQTILEKLEPQLGGDFEIDGVRPQGGRQSGLAAVCPEQLWG